jgi:D-methionine transport system permease protein
MSISVTINLLLVALAQTTYMTLVSGLIATLFGIPLGMILYTSKGGGILEQRGLNMSLGLITNAVRSIPFIVLLVAIIPFTRFVIGTSIGTNAAMVPLVIGAIPFIGRIVENGLNAIPKGLIEAAQSMGATPFQIMWKFLLPEALPHIIQGLTVTTIALVSYSAMAGAVSGGGLGDLAIRYGYQRFDGTMMLLTVIVLIVLVQLLQCVGDYITRKLDKNL